MALSIIDRIKINAAVFKGQLDFEREMANFKKEQKRANRAAGKNKNNGVNTDSNNTGIVNHNPEAEVKVEANTKKQTDTKTASIKTPIVAENNNTEAKTEQQINAESQAPEEPIGAEKIKPDAVVESATEAAMSGNVHINDHQNGKIECMGASIDLNEMCGEQLPHTGNIFNPSTNPVATHRTTIQNPIRQFELNPIDGMNTYSNFINQRHVSNPGVPMINPAVQMPHPGVPMINPAVQMPQPIPGYGQHKVDHPEKPKPVKPPRSEPEKIDMTGMPNPSNGMEIVDNKKIDVRTYRGLVTDKIPTDVDPVPIVNRFEDNNSAFYRNYPYLVEVEKVALENGYQIGFALRNNTNLIECHIYTNDGNPIPGKGFTIDPGMIIDRRKKIFPAIAQFYEGMNAYPLYVNNPNTKDDGKKAGNVLNIEVLKALIVGGNDAVDVRGMYTEDFRNLNKFVALITIPTEKNSAADRKYIQNRLVDLYKNGVFSDALATSSGSRFRVIGYNKGSGTILLDTDGVPANFGGPYVPNERIQLKITKDKCKTLRGENIIDIPEKNI